MTSTTVLTTLVTLVVGMLLPALVAVVTKAQLPVWLRQAVLALLAAVTGVLSSIVGAVPSTTAGWVAVLINIAVAFVGALSTQVSTWEQSGGLARIHRATASFGVAGPVAWRRPVDDVGMPLAA